MTGVGTYAKLLIYWLFQKGRVLVQDGIVLWSRLARSAAGSQGRRYDGAQCPFDSKVWRVSGSIRGGMSRGMTPFERMF